MFAKRSQLTALAIRSDRSRHDPRHHVGGLPMPKTNGAALGAFIARKAEIGAALDRIRAASDDHVFASPESVN